MQVALQIFEITNLLFISHSSAIHAKKNIHTTVQILIWATARCETGGLEPRLVSCLSAANH